MREVWRIDTVWLFDRTIRVIVSIVSRWRCLITSGHCLVAPQHASFPVTSSCRHLEQLISEDPDLFVQFLPEFLPSMTQISLFVTSFHFKGLRTLLYLFWDAVLIKIISFRFDVCVFITLHNQSIVYRSMERGGREGWVYLVTLTHAMRLHFYRFRFRLKQLDAEQFTTTLTCSRQNAVPVTAVQRAPRLRMDFRRFKQADQPAARHIITIYQPKPFIG